MKKIKSVVYGLGGYNENQPDNNLVAIEYYTDDELVELEKIEAKEAARQAIANRLGLTTDDLRALGL